jgi:protein involved in polysaccharide export with SLBB domain
MILLIKRLLIKEGRDASKKTASLFLFGLFLICQILFCVDVNAQNFSSQDLSKIKVDQLSDQQVLKIKQKAEEGGMSQQELEAMAEAKGMPRVEVDKLIARINGLAGNSQTALKPIAKTDSRLRTGPGSKGKVSTPVDPVNIFEEDMKLMPLKGKERIFGYSLFNNVHLTFEPQLNIATPKNYKLGVADEIIVDLWGASQQNYRLEISPEGNVHIDHLGPVYLNGLTIEQASDKLIKRLSSIYAGLQGPKPNTFAQVTLGNVRSINVTLLGEVNLPGTYTLTSLATVFNALHLSGGPSETGSFRSIQVIRDNKVVTTLDIYDFLLRGDQKDNVRLQDQDIIRVGPFKTRVEIHGEVKREGLYEVKSKESFADVIEFAGGFTDRAYKKRIRVVRNNGIEKQVFDIDFDEFASFTPEDGDIVTVSQIINRYENRVGITGAVFRPGLYALRNGMTVKDLLNKAEGIKEDAFVNRASIYRLLPDNTREVISFDLGALLRGEIDDIPLKREDDVQIASIFDLREEYTVSIKGAVIKPGTFDYVENMTLEDLIVLAKGFREAASSSRIEVSRRIFDVDAASSSAKIADVFYFDVSKDLRLNNDGKKFVLSPFDQVFIRQSPGYEYQRNVSIEGEIHYPGEYSIKKKDERISDIVKRAGGLTPEAYSKGAKLIRKTVLNEKELALLKKRMEALGKSVNDTSLIYEEIEKEDVVGINLGRIMANPRGKDDLILREGDIISIPQELQTVHVSGSVLYPNTVRYQSHNRLRSYITRSGGFAQNAKRKRVFVIYPNGEIKRTRNFIVFNHFPKVEPGSEIIVPQKAERQKLTPMEVMAIGSGASSTALIIVNLLRMISDSKK